MAVLPPLDLTFDGQAGPADVIILHHSPAWWIAEFRGPVASRVRAIAGAATVTTGFNGHVPGTVVCKAIAMLNPNAEVMLAKADEEQPPKKPPEAQPPNRTPDPLLALAADVVGTNHADIARARRIRRSLGTMAACSYLRDKGWTFDAAHRALIESKDFRRAS